MARMGTFAGATESFGDPVAFVQPVDNDFNKARFSDPVLDPRLKLTDKQMRELQQEIDDLYFALQMAREEAGGQKPYTR